MAESCLLYYITDRKAFAEDNDEPARRRLLLKKIAEATSANVDYIQLREKDLSTRDLESLAREAAGIIAKLKTENRELRTALLINSRTDVALAVGADGVHLRSDDVTAENVKKMWSRGADTHARQTSPRSPVIAVSCHSPAEVMQAAQNAATFAVFAPVFEKPGLEKKKAAPAGLDPLSQACRSTISVLALGGVTLANARSCLEAGAAGIAAIRLFQENEIAEVVNRLRQT
jgi:thiamine-phosphate pyrophosphorylase